MDDLSSPQRVHGFESGPVTALKLADMATFSVAISLCNHHVEKLRIERDPSAVFIQQYLLEEVYKLIHELRVPASISKSIKDFVTCITYEFLTWFHNHSLTVFRDLNAHHAVRNLFHLIVWYPSAEINLKATARNVVFNSPRLGDHEKFRLLCTYCLKDELESMWPSFVANNIVDYGGRLNESISPLFHYWDCYFNNNLDQIRLRANQSINSYMFQNPKVDTWPAKEYFFDRMTFDEQIQATISCIDRNQVDLQRAVLRKLNCVQLLEVYMVRVVKIIANYAARPVLYARQVCLDIWSVWCDASDLVTGDDFVTIFKHLFSSKSVGDIILEYVWSSAPDDLQRQLLYHNDHQMVTWALRLWIENTENDFFFDMLKSSPNVKRAITKESSFIQQCVDLIRDDGLSSIDRLLKFCFVEPDELEQFKGGLVKSELFIRRCEQLIREDKVELLGQYLNFLLTKNEELVKFKLDLSKKKFFIAHCEKLITDEELQKFNELLNVFFSLETDQLQFKRDLLTNSKMIKNYCLDGYTNKKRGFQRLNNFITSLFPSLPNFIVEYKRDLLMSSDGIDWCAARIDSKFNLNPVIDDCLPTPSLVAEFKQRLVFSPSAIDKLRKLVTSSRLNELDLYIDRYIVSNEDKIALKKRIMGNPADLICDFIRTNSDNETSDKWKSLVTQWPRDESTSLDFKSTLPLDDIFNRMLKDSIYSKYDPAHRLCYCKLRSNLQFSSLDWFLNWYFESPVKIAEYKFRRICAYVEIEALTTLLKKRDNTCLKTVLKWIFENDAQRIAEFKARKAGEKILDAMPCHSDCEVSSNNYCSSSN